MAQLSAAAENAFEACGVGCGKPEIEPGQAGPFLRGSGICIEQMGDRQARPQHCPMTAIEQKKPACSIVIQGTCQIPPDPLGGRQAAEAFAFQMQEGNFIERIERPQFWVEFQAVDDRDGLAQPDVLGTQVAMCIDEPPLCKSSQAAGRSAS